MTSYLDPTLIVLALVFIAVVLGAEALFLHLRDVHAARRRVNKRVRLLSEGKSNEEILAALRRVRPEDVQGAVVGPIVAHVEKQLAQAGWRLSARRLLAIMGGATVVIGVLFPLLGGITGSLRSGTALGLLMAFAVVLGVILPMAALNVAAAKRMKTLEAQFPVALDVFVRALRAGHPMSGALDLVVQEMPDPIGSEFGIVVSEMNYGYDLRQALAHLAKRVPTPDIEMFVVSVAIQSETGGNLAEILEGLARVVRERAAMVLKVRALASEGKMTGTMLSVLPVGTFAFVFSTQPSFYLDVIDDPWFMPGVLGTLGLYSTGILIIRKLIALKV